MPEAEFLQRLKDTGRNDPCLCGSGKKYKKCHLREDEEAEHKLRAEQEKARAEEARSQEAEDKAQPALEGRAKGRKDEGKPAPRPKGGKGGKQTMFPRRSGRTGR